MFFFWYYNSRRMIYVRINFHEYIFVVLVVLIWSETYLVKFKGTLYMVCFKKKYWKINGRPIIYFPFYIIILWNIMKSAHFQ